MLVVQDVQQPAPQWRTASAEVVMKLYVYTVKDGGRVVKARVHRWFDHHENRVMYGVQVKTEGQPHKFFGHVFDGEPLRPVLFADEQDAIKYKDELMAKAPWG